MNSNRSCCKRGSGQGPDIGDIANEAVEADNGEGRSEQLLDSGHFLFLGRWNAIYGLCMKILQCKTDTAAMLWLHVMEMAQNIVICAVPVFICVGSGTSIKIMLRRTNYAIFAMAFMIRLNLRYRAPNKSLSTIIEATLACVVRNTSRTI